MGQVSETVHFARACNSVDQPKNMDSRAAAGRQRSMQAACGGLLRGHLYSLDQRRCATVKGHVTSTTVSMDT